MKRIYETFKNRGELHHAYFIQSLRADARQALEKILEAVSGKPLSGNPDYYLWRGENFGIDDARALKAHHAQTNLGGKRFFVVETFFMTLEAQNALLKLLEEPGKDKHFFILSGTETFLLPTVRSRLVFLRDETVDESVSPDAETAEDFLDGDLTTRMGIVNALMKEEGYGRTISFLNGLEALLSKRLEAVERNITPFRGIVELLSFLRSAREFIMGRKGNKKALLEHLAFSAPFRTPVS